MKRFVIMAALLTVASSFDVRAQDTTGKARQIHSTSAVEITPPPDRSSVAQLPSQTDSEAPNFEPYVHSANFSLRAIKSKYSTRSFKPIPPLSESKSVALNSAPADSSDEPEPVSQKFDWSSAIKQSMFFLAVQHGYAVTQPKTQTALKGPFFQDYFDSVRSLHGWDDGGRFFTNYIAHPLQGAFAGFIQVHNDPKGKGLTLSNSKAYWASRAKALAWSAAWSTQFEIGPISQASAGNVGLQGKQTWGDIVITPTVGTVIMIAEDALDKYIIRGLERWTKNYYVRIFARMLLNPTRTMANLIRIEIPWHRDKGLR